MSHGLFIHSPTEGRGILVCTQFLAIMNEAAVNSTCRFLRGYKFSIPLGKWGKSVFSFVSNCQTAFDSSCAILYSHRQWMRVSVFSHLRQHLVLSVFLISAIPIGMGWYGVVILIWISMMRDDVEFIFTHPNCHLYIFFGEVPAKTWPIVLFGSFGGFLLVVEF